MLLNVGVRWRSDYYAYYGNPSCVRISNVFDTYKNRNGPMNHETNAPSIFPVLKYGNEVEEAEEQQINWESGTCINYSSAVKHFQKKNEEDPEIDTMSVDFDTIDGIDVTSSKQNDSAYVKLSPYFKSLCQCIPDDNKSIICYAKVLLQNISNTITQRILEDGDGGCTFFMLTTTFLNYQPLQGNRN